MTLDADFRSAIGNLFGVVVSKSCFKNAGLGLFCGKGGVDFICNRQLHLKQYLKIFRFIVISATISTTDLEVGHLIPYFGCLAFHTEDPAHPGEPVGILPAFRHLRDKIVLLKNQPIVYPENAGLVMDQNITFASHL